MKKPSSLLCTIFILGVLSGTIFGLGINHRSDSTALIKKAYAASETDTVILADHGVIRFLIEGKEVGRFDKDGLHVVGNVDYTGTLTDTGLARPDQTPSEKGEKNAK